MTIGAIKQALLEVKEICNGCERCEDCPFSNDEGDCIMLDPELTSVYPSYWPLDWEDDD